MSKIKLIPGVNCGPIEYKCPVCKSPIEDGRSVKNWYPAPCKEDPRKYQYVEGEKGIYDCPECKVPQVKGWIHSGVCKACSVLNSPN